MELKNFSREELEQIIEYQHYTMQHLREQLYKLTGCYNFGSCDGMDGSCHYCSEQTPETFEKCWNFSYRKGENNDCVR